MKNLGINLSIFITCAFIALGAFAYSPDIKNNIDDDFHNHLQNCTPYNKYWFDGTAELKAKVSKTNTFCTFNKRFLVRDESAQEINCKLPISMVAKYTENSNIVRKTNNSANESAAAKKYISNIHHNPQYCTVKNFSKEEVRTLLSKKSKIWDKNIKSDTERMYKTRSQFFINNLRTCKPGQDGVFKIIGLKNNACVTESNGRRLYSKCEIPMSLINDYIAGYMATKYSNDSPMAKKFFAIKNQYCIKKWKER